MEISSARLIWLISSATRCATGAREVTHGQEALAARPAVTEARPAVTEARPAVTEAWLAAAVAGTASSAASAAARTSRPFLHFDKVWQTRATMITLSSGSDVSPVVDHVTQQELTHGSPDRKRRPGLFRAF